MTSVDVIVPCYNYGRFLSQCVRSALDQEGVSTRVLVIDDSSSDGTPAVGAQLANSDQRVTFRRHRANMGHIATYNEGIEWATAKYLLLLSADDYLLPGALRASVELMESRPGIAFCFGKTLQGDPNGDSRPVDPLRGKRKAKGNLVLSGEEFIHLSGGACLVSTPSAVVRTALQKQVGGYRADLPFTADMELWLELATLGDVGFIDAFQAMYRRHDTNMSAAANLGFMLPDLQLRKQTLDFFLGRFGSRMPDFESSRSHIYHDLACCAIDAARSAFNAGDMAMADEISRFALAASPKIVRSPHWYKLLFMRTVGRGVWSRLREIKQLMNA